MDLPAHVLYTYALEKIALPSVFSNNPQFILASLVFAGIPDILETAPLLVYLAVKRKKFGLTSLKSIINFATDIVRNRQDEYERMFPWAAWLSFMTHSVLVYALFALFLFIFFPVLCLPFIIGFGLHIFTDIFMHDDFYSSRPFYPVSNLSIPGFFTWYKIKNFSLYNYIILTLLYFVVFVLFK